MPQCVQCHEFLPPDLCVDLDGGLAKKCIFCVRGVSDVLMEDGSLITKQFAIYDYKEFIQNVVNTRNVKDIVVESAVRKHIKQ